MNMKIYRVLIDDSDDPSLRAEREKVASEDWLADSQGYGCLDKARFTLVSLCFTYGT